ncbi:glucose-6-phosphate dehydrogenase (NADP(+)) [Candidatus Saccharibacteria bacterium]|nr:glucose-6-phosphate dehydrogenase (NADP(+)) [Candidatus Saccharibacteria bacterium]
MSPTILVIFGVTGDLAQRKLLPALAAIEKNRQLPADFKLLGVTRRDVSLDDVLSSECKHLSSKMEMYQMNLEEPAAYEELKNKLDSNAQIIFYFAVPPSASRPIIRHLGQAKLNGSQTKLLLEKPFGVDYVSAEELIEETQQHFKEEQIYRIDHYLAKEMAQNIAVFLGGNVLFRDVWNNNYIDKVEIIASEKIGIEGRVAFYEQAGALRDIIQSHLLQLTALVLMEACPDVFDFSEVPRRRLAALLDIEPVEPSEPGAVVRAQYASYRDEVSNPNSQVETFVSLQLQSNNPKWKGVKLHLITGKALDRKFTEIRVYFKRAQIKEANLLTLRIQPMEGIELDLWVKKPGYEHDLAKLPLQFNYEQHFGADLPDAYEQVLVDAMRSRANLFASSAEILATWKILDPVLKAWAADTDDLKVYKQGSSYQQVLES